jgi:phosphate transport system substrate-binding protein
MRGGLLLLWVMAATSCMASPWAQRPATPTPMPVITTHLTFAGSTTVQPLVELLAERYKQRAPQTALDTVAGGSVVGINAVQDGQVDIGMSSRRLLPHEERGIRHYQIANDVLAVIVHPSNPATSLSLEQLRAIYTGAIRNWRELGGPDLPIVPVIREVSSGTRGAFDEIALAGAEPLASADVQITAGEVEARVATSPGAVGYVGFGNVQRNIKVLAIEGVAPSATSARDGSYPLVRPLLLLRGPLSRPEAQDFIDYVLSDEGQQIVTSGGWVSMR